MGRRPMIESISAITLATHDMPRAVRFYRMLGFEVIFGGDEAAFTSFRAGTSYLNLIAQPAERTWSWWGRVIPLAALKLLRFLALPGRYPRPCLSGARQRVRQARPSGTVAAALMPY